MVEEVASLAKDTSSDVITDIFIPQPCLVAIESSMVSVNQQTLNRNSSLFRPTHILLVLGCLVVIYIGGVARWIGGSNDVPSSDQTVQMTKSEERQLRTERVNRPNRPQSIEIVLDESRWEKAKSVTFQDSCAYQSLGDVPKDELYPRKGERHMIDPPSGGKLSLVCCVTTAGPLTIVAHHKWAPLGAERFLAMVTSGYFDSGVPFMRCVKGFLCQFGLNSDSTKEKDFKDTIQDDANWLPEGPTGRQNEQGVKRFAPGYLAYAGSGKNSRSKQLIMALKANGPLAGGSPWEVPWGEIVHKESFETLSKIYTGYGEHGPPQGQLGSQGMTDEMKEKWSELDYINSCSLVDERILEEDMSSEIANIQ